MSVLLVGGSGYVGQFLTRALLERGFQVHVSHRPGRKPTVLPPEVRLVELDFTDAESTAAALRSVAPSAVVNCAAIAGLGACEKDPAAALAANCPRGLVEAAASEGLGPEGARLFVHFSTDIVFAGDPAVLHDEDTAVGPVNAYGRSKAEFDAHLASRRVPTCVVLRPTNIVGPKHPYGSSGGGAKFLQWLDARLRTDEQTKLFQDEYRNYVWVEDLVAVAVKLIEEFPAARPQYSLMHCGGPEALNRVQVAEALAAAKGYSLTFTPEGGGETLERIVPVPRAEVDLGYPSPLCIRFRSSRAEEFLGRPMRSIAECCRASADLI